MGDDPAKLDRTLSELQYFFFAAERLACKHETVPYIIHFPHIRLVTTHHSVRRDQVAVLLLVIAISIEHPHDIVPESVRSLNLGNATELTSIKHDVSGFRIHELPHAVLRECEDSVLRPSAHRVEPLFRNKASILPHVVVNRISVHCCLAHFGKAVLHHATASVEPFLG